MKKLDNLGFTTSKIKVNSDIDYGGSSRSLKTHTGATGGGQMLRVRAVWSTWAGDVAYWADKAKW
tara:strand:- start:359 stop:553 length:195 start_codon:yes stop_codon:yes gene_type:complete